jgi:hypothetical protein
LFSLGSILAHPVCVTVEARVLFLGSTPNRWLFPSDRLVWHFQRVYLRSTGEYLVLFSSVFLINCRDGIAQERAAHEEITLFALFPCVGISKDRVDNLGYFYFWLT